MHSERSLTYLLDPAYSDLVDPQDRALVAQVELLREVARQQQSSPISEKLQVLLDDI